MESPQESSEIPYMFGIHGASYCFFSFCLGRWATDVGPSPFLPWWTSSHMTTKKIIVFHAYTTLDHLHSVSAFAEVFHIHNLIRFSQRCGVGQAGIIIHELQMRTSSVGEAKWFTSGKSGPRNWGVSGVSTGLEQEVPMSGLLAVCNDLCPSVV